jgi:hypothetical protein
MYRYCYKKKYLFYPTSMIFKVFSWFLSKLLKEKLSILKLHFGCLVRCRYGTEFSGSGCDEEFQILADPDSDTQHNETEIAEKNLTVMVMNRMFGRVPDTRKYEYEYSGLIRSSRVFMTDKQSLSYVQHLIS